MRCGGLPAVVGKVKGLERCPLGWCVTAVCGGVALGAGARSGRLRRTGGVSVRRSSGVRLLKRTPRVLAKRCAIRCFRVISFQLCLVKTLPRLIQSGAQAFKNRRPPPVRLQWMVADMREPAASSRHQETACNIPTGPCPTLVPRTFSRVMRTALRYVWRAVSVFSHHVSGHSYAASVWQQPWSCSLVLRGT